MTTANKEKPNIWKAIVLGGVALVGLCVLCVVVWVGGNILAASSNDEMPTVQPTATRPANGGVGMIGAWKSWGDTSILVMDVKTIPDVDGLGPQDGYKLLYVDLAIRNDHPSDVVEVEEINFSMGDESGERYDKFNIYLPEDFLANSYLLPGDFARGSLVFEVPKDSNHFILYYDYYIEDETIRIDLDRTAGNPDPEPRWTGSTPSAIGTVVGNQDISITFLGLEKFFEPAYGYQLPAGYTLLHLEIKVTNVGTATFNLHNTDLYLKDSAGYVYSDINSDYSEIPILQDADLIPGEGTQGSLIFRVPDDAESLRFVLAPFLSPSSYVEFGLP